jgi:hypothetical protein
MIRIVFALLAGVLVGCGETVTTRFSDIEHAQREHAFERGWLPPILPLTSKDIVECNNLDINQGEGSFRFEPRDVDHFILSGAQVIKIHPPAESPQAKLQSEGFRFLKYSRRDTDWIIAVQPDGRGYYWVTNTKK